jgi:hypothetical protein
VIEPYDTRGTPTPISKKGVWGVTADRLG